MMLKKLSTLIMVIAFSTLIFGCDALDEEEPELENLLEMYAEYDNITIHINTELVLDEETQKMDTTIMFDGHKQKHEFEAESNEQTMHVIFYLEYLEETFNVWRYTDGELAYHTADEPLDADVYESNPLNILDLNFFKVRDFNLEWFIYTDGYFTIAEEHEEAFLMFVSEDDYDPEVDEIEKLNVQLTAEYYVVEIDIIEDGAPTTLNIRFDNRDATTVELPEIDDETED